MIAGCNLRDAGGANRIPNDILLKSCGHTTRGRRLCHRFHDKTRGTPWSKGGFLAAPLAGTRSIRAGARQPDAILVIHFLPAMHPFGASVFFANNRCLCRQLSNFFYGRFIATREGRPSMPGVFSQGPQAVLRIQWGEGVDSFASSLLMARTGALATDGSGDGWVADRLTYRISLYRGDRVVRTITQKADWFPPGTPEQFASTEYPRLRTSCSE